MCAGRVLSTDRAPDDGGIAPGGYRELLRVAVPLMVATGAHSVQLFVDRLFLSWHSREAIAAAAPAGMSMWTAMALFMAVVGYVSTFVSQYHGAGQSHRIGASVWQSIYLGLLSYAIMLPLWFVAPFVFRWAGHDPAIRPAETIYFRILLLGSIFPLFSIALSSFFSGRGRTLVVMGITMAVTVINVVLDYLLIFGKMGFPALGIAGAGYATVTATAVGAVAYAFLFFARVNRDDFNTLRGARPDFALARRLLRFGVPHGFQSLIDATTWTFWIFIIGGIGTLPLAVTNIVWSISLLALLPAFGIGQAVQILVGRHLGGNRDDLAAMVTRRGLVLSMLFMASVALVFVYAPRLPLSCFAAKANPADWSDVEQLAIVILRFVAVYTISDSVALVYASALRGAGDTRFTMVVFLISSILVLAAPSFIAVRCLGRGILSVWTIATIYCFLVSVVLFLRYRQGKWRRMRVIE